MQKQRLAKYLVETDTYVRVQENEEKVAFCESRSSVVNH